MRRRGQTHPTLPSAEPSRTSATRAERKSLRKDRQVLRNTAGWWEQRQERGDLLSGRSRRAGVRQRFLQCADETGHVPLRDADDVSEAKAF